MTTDIDVINDANILGNDSMSGIRNVIESIETGFKLRQRFRPRYLMEVSVLNNMKYPTPDSKYWQCNIERDTHFKNLVMLSYDYRDKQDEIQICQFELIRLQKQNDPIAKIKAHKKQTQIDRENTLLIYMRKEAEERAREILEWTDIMNELEGQLKYSKTDVEEHMPEAYAARFANELEAMKVAGALNASDTNGAMNVISVAQAAFEKMPKKPHENNRSIDNG